MLSAEQVATLRMAPLTGANKLSLAIELSGRTQVDIAEAIGSSQGAVSKAARGVFPKLPVDTARKYAEFFGCAIEDLFPARDDERQAVNS